MIDRDELEEIYSRLVDKKDCNVCNPACSICQDMVDAPCPCRIAPKAAFRPMTLDDWIEIEKEMLIRWK